MKKVTLAVVLAYVAISSTALAIDWSKHPNLRDAKGSIADAKRHLKEANDHEKSEFGGHRGNAEKLLDQADQEINQAADWADSHH
jgi:hypothetical protein